jgi:hypothetical protein
MRRRSTGNPRRGSTALKSIDIEGINTRVALNCERSGQQNRELIVKNGTILITETGSDVCTRSERKEKATPDPFIFRDIDEKESENLNFFNMSSPEDGVLGS